MSLCQLLSLPLSCFLNLKVFISKEIGYMNSVGPSCHSFQMAGMMNSVAVQGNEYDFSFFHFILSFSSYGISEFQKN